MRSNYPRWKCALGRMAYPDCPYSVLDLPSNNRYTDDSSLEFVYFKWDTCDSPCASLVIILKLYFGIKKKSVGKVWVQIRTQKGELVKF